jgi:TolB-like protein/Tfp pilus assembly protein PilF
MVGMSLYAELKRRNVFRVAAAYIVLGWLFLQIASVVLGFVGAPDWVGKAIIALLVIGFVPALAVAWVFEVGPEGVRRDDGVQRPSNGQHARRLDILTLVGVVIVAIMVLADNLRGPGKPESAPEPPVAAAVQAPSTPGVPTDVRPAPPAPARKSIAVLPFVNLSADPEQEFFSDGMAEEIINALTRIRDLKVAGRTSSFHFKGRNEDLRAIGEALGVAHILEGSVRKQGGKVRITAQLIQASDGFHLWSETYDGDLADVFELQERIARAITGKLEVVLQGDQATPLVQVGTTNAEAYGLYLKATALLNQRIFRRWGEAVGWLEKALELDPGFARAHARLALIHEIGPAEVGASPIEAERHARRAEELDPSLGEPHVVLAGLARSQRRYVEGFAEIERALSLEPDDASVNLFFSQTLIVTGYTQRGIEGLERTLAIDPMLPNALYWRGQQYLHAGELDAAQLAFERADTLGLAWAWRGLQDLARKRGDPAWFVEPAGRERSRPGVPCLKDSAASLPLLYAGADSSDATARARALAVIDECLATPTAEMSWLMPSYLIRLGLPARALGTALKAPLDNEAGFFIYFWSPEAIAARRAPEFAEFARAIGLADLWDERGPPDGCRRVAPRDYACD